MQHDRLDVDQARLRYRYQPQVDPSLAAQQAAFRAGASVPEIGHRTCEREDPTIGNEEFIRGIPLVGRVSGTMRGTRPGDDPRLLYDIW
jgi:hypothetical protein